MQLSDYPRPPDDNGRGIHWSAGIDHPPGHNLDFWIDELVAMHMKWVKLLDDGHASSLELCRRLIDAGIMPVVRLYRERSNPGRIGKGEVNAIGKLVAVGVRYFETNNEPDCPTEWENDRKPVDWLEVVVDNFLYDADIVLGEGGLLAVPAMRSGGHREIIQRIVDRDRADLFASGCWVAIHNYTRNRPPDYPDDPVNRQGKSLSQEAYARLAPWAWDGLSLEEINQQRQQEKDTNSTVADDPDCFRAWEVAGQIIHEALGRYVPVISSEGGPVVGCHDDKRYPKVTPNQQAEWQASISRFMQEKAPDWYFACCTWLLAGRALGNWHPTWESMSWYTDNWNEQFDLAGQLPVVEAMKDLSSQPRGERRQGRATLTIVVERADSGAPVANTRIEVEAAEDGPFPRQCHQRQTDEQGKIELEDLPAGRYRLLLLNAEMRQIDLEANEDKKIELKVQDGHQSRIHGQVTDADGVPQAGLTVGLYRPAPLRLLEEVRTDDGGHYQFDGLGAEKLQVQVTGGTDEPSQRRGVVTNGWDAQTVDISIPTASSRIYRVVEKRLLPPEETGHRNLLCGQVLDSAGEPLDGITVRVRWTGASLDTPFPTVKSGQSPFHPPGHFEFIHTPGVFKLDVVDANVESEVADNLITADMPERRRPISYAVTFQLATPRPPARSRVQGRILGGRPGMTLTLAGGGEEPRLGRLDDRGTFRFEHLPAGTYQLRLEEVGVIAEALQLDGSNDQSVEFALLGRIQGRVLPAETGATVILIGQQYGIRRQTQTDGEGRYGFIHLPADVYKLALEASHLPSEQVACDGRSPMDGPTFDREQGAQSAIRGRLTNHREEPVARTRLWLRTRGERVAETQTDADGSYRFTGLGAGMYSLELLGPGLVAQEIELDGHNERTVNVELPPTARSTIDGQILDHTGLPLANQTIRLRGSAQRRQTSTADGTFHFEHLPGGRYTVQVVEHPQVQATTTVDDEERRDVTLRLPEPSDGSPTAIGHYLLVATGSMALAQVQLTLATDYILRKGTTVGFDPALCREAAHVTIIGAADPVLVRTLEEAKIPYQQISGDLYQMQTELEALP